MTQTLTVQLSDTVYATLHQRAKEINASPADLAAAALEQQFGDAKQRRGGTPVTSDAERQAARERFQRHIGAVAIGHAAGADNDAIDADLAREYADRHEGA
jgi:predicted transcriptional regulator